MDGQAPRRRRQTPVGRTGARFAPAVSLGEPEQPPRPPLPAAGPGPIGARFGPYSARRSDDEPPVPTRPEPGLRGLDRYADGPYADGRSEPRWHQRPAWPDPSTVGRPAPAEHLPSESHVLIRPYARTGGRTRPTHDLAIEALISTAPAALGRVLSREHRAIANLCVHPRSVAEVAALLTIPLGVARVLLGDLATDGTVVIHRTSQLPPDLALMRRVLTGLRRL